MTNTPDATTPTPADREAFERWYAEDGSHDLGWIKGNRFGTTYHTPSMALTWDAYQAALTHAHRTHAAELAAAERREQRLGEPMFILLGRDSAAPFAIEVWCNIRLLEIEAGSRADTPLERRHVDEVFAKATAFRSWRAALLDTPTDIQSPEPTDAD